MNYDFLISHINSFKTDEEKLKFISTYIVKNVKYNYRYLDNSKVSNYLKNNDPDSNVDFDKVVEAVKFIDKLSSELSLTDEYKNQMLQLYSELIISGCRVEFLNILPQSKVFQYENGLLKFGVCQQISEFFNKLCFDAGMNSRIVRGNTGFAHQWNVVKLNGEDLHYDCTYSIYSKDGYKDWNKKTSPKDWLGVTEQKLKQLDTNRTIDHIM